MRENGPSRQLTVLDLDTLARLINANVLRASIHSTGRLNYLVHSSRLYNLMLDRLQFFTYRSRSTLSCFTPPRRASSVSLSVSEL